MIQVRTESGTMYHVNPHLRTWAVVEEAERDSPLRTRMGEFADWSGALVGSKMWFKGKGFAFGERKIETSPIVSVEFV